MSVTNRGSAAVLPATIGLLVCLVGLLVSVKAMAGQSGGSIYYEDRAAVGQELEFRAFVWPVRDGYYRAVVDYRQAGSRPWGELDKNWCWYRRCALKKMITQARYIAQDGYVWRFQEPAPAPARAKRYRFTEACYSNGTAACADRLMKGS